MALIQNGGKRQLKIKRSLEQILKAPRRCPYCKVAESNNSNLKLV